jgi:hypothetical protein
MRRPIAGEKIGIAVCLCVAVGNSAVVYDARKTASRVQDAKARSTLPRIARATVFPFVGGNVASCEGRHSPCRLFKISSTHRAEARDWSIGDVEFTHDPMRYLIDPDGNRLNLDNYRRLLPIDA